MNRNYWAEDCCSDEYEAAGKMAAMKAKAVLGYIAFGVIALLWYATTWAQAPCAWNEDCLAWNRPTTYTDGSALDPANIASYIVESAAVGSSAWTQLGTTTAPTQGYKRTGLKHGDAYQYRVIAVLKSGVRSVPSNVATSTTTEPAPSPPELQVTDALAYEIYSPQGVLTARGVGVVPIGTPCLSETQRVGTITYNRVASDRVDRDVRLNQPNWRKNADVKLWARCG